MQYHTSPLCLARERNPIMSPRFTTVDRIAAWFLKQGMILAVEVRTLWMHYRGAAIERGRWNVADDCFERQKRWSAIVVQLELGSTERPSEQVRRVGEVLQDYAREVVAMRLLDEQLGLLADDR